MEYLILDRGVEKKQRGLYHSEWPVLGRQFFLGQWFEFSFERWAGDPESLGCPGVIAWEFIDHVIDMPGLNIGEQEILLFVLVSDLCHGGQTRIAGFAEQLRWSERGPLLEQDGPLQNIFEFPDVPPARSRIQAS